MRKLTRYLTWTPDGGVSWEEGKGWLFVGAIDPVILLRSMENSERLRCEVPPEALEELRRIVRFNEKYGKRKVA